MPINWCSCIDGALTKENYINSIKEAGFKDVKILNEQLYMDEDKTDGRIITSMVIGAVTGNEILLNPKKSEKTVLFVCVENAGRSQMAEGFFNKYAPKGYKAISAGTKPVSEINPIAVEAMKEVGIDISNQKSKDITEDMMRNSDKDCKYGLHGKGIMSNSISA